MLPDRSKPTRRDFTRQASATIGGLAIGGFVGCQSQQAADSGGYRGIALRHCGPSHSAIPAIAEQARKDLGINIELITTSEIRITCIVAQERIAEAVRALHAAFELDRA